MQNPSFETVIGPAHAVAPGFNGVLGWDLPPGATHVAQWEADGPVTNPYAFVSNVTTVSYGSASFPQTAFQGSRYAAMTISFGYQYGFLGRLSTATAVGATYLLSAEVESPIGSNGVLGSQFTLRLRNGTTHAESAPVAQATVTQSQAGHWLLVSGNVAANAHYDQVVLRHRVWLSSLFDPGVILHPPVDFDDVHLCLIAAHGSGWWTLGHAIAVGGAVVLGGLVVGAVLWRRSHNYKGIVTLLK